MSWSTTKSFQKLGWLTIQQEVAYKTVSMAIKVIQTKQPRSLYEKVTTARLVSVAGQWHEIIERRLMTKEELARIKLSTRKSWAVRAIRWMAQIPPHLLKTCFKKHSSKKELKDWCLKNVPTTGDRILRGKVLEEGKPEAGDNGDGDEDSPGGGYEQNRRQQRMMKTWMQKQHQRKEKGTTEQNTGRRQEKSRQPATEEKTSQEEKKSGREQDNKKKHMKIAKEQESETVASDKSVKLQKTEVMSINIKSREEDAKVKHVIYLIVLLFLFCGIVARKYQEEKMKCSSLDCRLVQQLSYWEKTSTRVGDSTRAGIG